MEIFKKLANFIYVWLEGLENKPFAASGKSKVLEDLVLLEPTADIPKKHKQFVVEKLSLCLLILTVGGLFSGLMWIKSSKDTAIEDNRIYRNKNGEGSYSVDLMADMGDEKVSLDLSIEERSYTHEELTDMYDEFVACLKKEILGKNESYDVIEYDLNLVDSLEEYPFLVDWETDSEYVDYTGELIKDEIDKPVVVEICAIINGEDFTQLERIACSIHSRKEPHTAQELLKKQLKKIEENSRYEDYVILPESFKDRNILWSRNGSNMALLCLILTPIAAIFIYIGKDRDLHELVVKREEEMKRDYPEIVSKLSLYIGAGMTVQNAWSKVALDYQNKKNKTGNRRYAYEEMLITMREIDSGITLYDAYDRFGKRCRVSCYTKTATLLSQNIRKGSSNIAMLLKEESNEAFEERKHSARKLGEKAGTKLLAPMMMLLIMVMVIILVPAFMNQF